MANQITILEQIKALIKGVKTELDGAANSIVTISKNAREAKTALTFNSPKAVNVELKKTAEATTHLNETLKQQAKLEKDLIVALAKKEAALTTTAKQVAKQRFETKQLNKINTEEAILTSRLATEYQKLVVKMNQAGRAVQNLNAKKAQGKKLSDLEQKELQQSTQEFKKYRAAVVQADLAIGRSQRNVGNYRSALKGLGLSFTNILSAFGLTSGIFIFAGAVRDAFQRIRDFDKSMQNLAGVMRTTRDGVKDLESTIIGVASATVRTSNEVAQLAESLATLGKSQGEIKDLLKPIVDLSLGLDAPADEAGEFLVQMLNTFGESTDSAEEFADTIATIRTSTTLNFQRMRDSFQYIAPISRLLNKDLAYTGSIVGILADNGLKAEQAGRLLSTAQIKLATQGKTLNDALTELNKAQKEGADELEILTLANDLFGKQASKVGAILAFNTEAIETNAQAIRDNGGALEDLTTQQLESLDARLKILDSTYEGFILSLDNGNSVIGKTAKFFIDALSLSIKHLEWVSNNTAFAFKGVFGVLTGNANIFKEQYDQVQRMKKGLSEATIEIEKQTQAFIDLHGSMAPLTKEQQTLIDNQEKINRLFGNFVGALAEDEEPRTLNVINAELKAQNELLAETDVKNKTLIKSIQVKIKALEAERDAILGKTKALKKQREEQESILKSVMEAGNQLKRQLGDVFVSGIINNEQYLRSLDRIDTALDGLVDGYDALKTLENPLEGLSGTLAPDMLKPIEDLEFQIKNLPWGDALAKASEFFGEMGNLASTLYDGNIQRIDDEINRNDLKYSELLKNETLSLEQRAALEAEQEGNRLQLEKKKREEQKKQAIVQKAFSASQIIANTAVAISKTLAETGVFGIPLTAIVAAQGALQLATVLAQPIPEFKDGYLEGDYAGKAKINDEKGSSYKEIVERKSGRLEMFNQRNKVITMQKGDKVHRAGTFNGQDITRQVTMMNMMAQGQMVNDAVLNNTINIDINEKISKEIKKGFSGLAPHKNEPINHRKLAKALSMQTRANKA